MPQQIVMKTNVNKTSTGLKIPVLPKAAKGMDRIIAGTVDLILIFVATEGILGLFDLQKVLGEIHQYCPHVFVSLFLYLTFTVIPHALFSQTIGKFFMKIKVVKFEDYKTLGLAKSVQRDLLLRPLCLLMPWTLNNKKGQAPHDRMCSSVVVVAK